MKVSILSQSSRSSNNVSGTSLLTSVAPSVSHQCFTSASTLRAANFSSPAGCGQTLSRGLSKGAVQSQRRPPRVSQNIPGPSGSQTSLHGVSEPGRWVRGGGSMTWCHAVRCLTVFGGFRWNVSPCPPAARTGPCRTAGRPRIPTACGAALEAG